MLDAHSGLAQVSALDLSQNGIGHFGIPRQHLRLNHVSTLTVGCSGDCGSGHSSNITEAAVDDDGFAYSAVSFPIDIISSDQEWCLKGAKGVQEEVEDGTSMILDTGCTKAICSRRTS